MITGTGVHDRPESAFTIDWNECSRSTGIRVHDPPEYALLVTQETIKHFGPDGGSIINLSTTVTRNPPAGASLYVASKSAIEAVTRVLAKELGPRKIRVNAISPGEVETEGTRTAGIIGSDFEKQLLQQTPLGRVGQPSDIALVAVFLASDDARWVTGEILAASGGL